MGFSKLNRFFLIKDCLSINKLSGTSHKGSRDFIFEVISEIINNTEDFITHHNKIIYCVEEKIYFSPRIKVTLV